MRKICFKLTLAAFLFCGPAAFAQEQELVSLSCVGANGLLLHVAPDSPLVSTQLGLAFGTYQTNKIVFIFDILRMTRIPLGLLGAPNAYVFDIYLKKVPVPGKKEALSGVIGSTVYNVAAPAFPAPIPVPAGFYAQTTLECEILTK